MNYIALSTPALTEITLHQEGVATCQTFDPNSTAMVSMVTLSVAATNGFMEV